MDAGNKPNWSPVAIGLAYIVLIVLASIGMAQDGVVYFVGAALFVGSISVKLPLVRALNAFWRHEQPGLPERTRLSGKAWIVVVIGALIWISSISAAFQSNP
jgi:hypothetical protein